MPSRSVVRRAPRVTSTRASWRSDHEFVDAGNLPVPATPVMLIVGDPRQAFALTFIPNAGVGLARTEFIINSKSASIRWPWPGTRT